MDLLDTSRRRLTARRDVVVAATALTAAFWGGAQLPLGAALAGLLGVLAWAALWPVPADGATPVGASSSPFSGTAPASPPSETIGLPGWQSLLDGIPAAALFLDQRSTIMASNATARDVHALRPGQHLSLAMRSPDLHDAVDRARRTGQPQSAEVRIATPVERSLTIHATPLARRLAEAGPALLIVVSDRTEEQQLNQLRADFVANASHELRTPLASVKGFIETLRGPAKDDAKARERFLGIMQEQADRMSRLIDDLLSLSRIEMREHLPPRDVVDLAEIAADVSASLQSMAEAAGQRLTLTTDDVPARVCGDRDELAQVAQNLVQNAIKYGKPGGTVNVILGRSGRRITFAVADDGIGIAPEHVPRLTERFYRVSAKNSRERGGTGLGLAIVKHIVNRHRGELRITSELGKGSTFEAILPAADEAP